MTKARSGIRPLTTYERMGMRVQKLVSDPRVQKAQEVLVSRREEEPEEDWDRLMEDLRSTDGIVISACEDGLRISWKAYIDA